MFASSSGRWWIFPPERRPEFYSSEHWGRLLMTVSTNKMSCQHWSTMQSLMSLISVMEPPNACFQSNQKKHSCLQIYSCPHGQSSILFCLCNTIVSASDRKSHETSELLVVAGMMNKSIMIYNIWQDWVENPEYCPTHWFSVAAESIVDLVTNFNPSLVNQSKLVNTRNVARLWKLLLLGLPMPLTMTITLTTSKVTLIGVLPADFVRKANISNDSESVQKWKKDYNLSNAQIKSIAPGPRKIARMSTRSYSTHCQEHSMWIYQILDNLNANLLLEQMNLHWLHVCKREWKWCLS